jgi:hypothetical protein
MVCIMQSQATDYAQLNGQPLYTGATSWTGLDMWFGYKDVF